ncbi:MAG: TonB-dependent receptor, partial [Ignavibacteriales bacterium CG_4_9_14_3_um_filter_34_10]
MKVLLRLIFVLFIIVTVTNKADNDLGTTGKIAGKISDTVTGDPLPFVNVIVLGTTIGGASDIDGNYSILNIPPGNYNVKASAIGYNAVTVTNVRVSIDLTTQVDFQLNETSLQLGQDVVVVATKPLIQKDLTASTAIVGGELISELPVTEISDVLSLQAGVVTGAGGDLHIRGGRSGQVTYQIDGVPITDAYDGGSVVNVNTSAVQELQVISGAFNAEYGQALSGVINLVTKDGNNNFNGSVSAYTGDYVSNRDKVFWNITDINPINIQNYEGSLSGPILKDRLFFFTNARFYKNLGYFYG